MEQDKKMVVLKLPQASRRALKTTLWVAVAILIAAAIWYVFQSGIFLNRLSKLDKDLVNQMMSDYYVDYVKSVNTNDGWRNLIDGYTDEREKTRLTQEANGLMYDAFMAKQHQLRLLSSPKIEILGAKTDRCALLAIVELEESILGFLPEFRIERTIYYLEKSGNKWLIVYDEPYDAQAYGEQNSGDAAAIKKRVNDFYDRYFEALAGKLNLADVLSVFTKPETGDDKIFIRGVEDLDKIAGSGKCKFSMSWPVAVKFFRLASDSANIITSEYMQCTTDNGEVIEKENSSLYRLQKSLGRWYIVKSLIPTEDQL